MVLVEKAFYPQQNTKSTVDEEIKWLKVILELNLYTP